MRTNKMMRIASALLVAVLLTTCAISGTFAKYISTASGSDSARVAKWSIEVEGDDIAVSPERTITFDLFNTVNDTAGATEENVTVGSGETIIAPGTSGSFTLDIANTSEVDATYTIELAEANAGNIPLKYSVDGTTWVDSVDELTMTALTNVAIAKDGDTDTQTVYWKWVFDSAAVDAADLHDGQTDATDTALGIQADDATPAVVTITATITATQVD